MAGPTFTRVHVFRHKKRKLTPYREVMRTLGITEGGGRRPPRRRYTMRSGNDEGSNTQINGRNVSMFKGFQNNRERVADTVAWRGLARYSTRLVCCPSHQRRPKLFRGSSDHEHGSNKKSYGRNTGSHYIIFVLENMVMCS